MLRIIIISILICLMYLTTPISSASKYNEDENQPYEFRFKIENNQHRYEKRDENGIVMGEFGFVTADGIYHHTVYATDEEGSFKIVAMQNLNIDDIDDLYNIPRPASVPKFEIVPLKVLAPFSYNAVVTTQYPNIPLIQGKPLDSKTCSNCKVPTTKRPIPITFAPIQRNTQKPLGVGLPEKLTTYRQMKVTPKPIVSTISEFTARSELGVVDDNYQVSAPEDQTQPIQKLSILPTQSTFTSPSVQKLQPQLQLNIAPNNGKLVNTIKDSIHQISLQQSNIRPHSPENVQVIQRAGVPKTSLGTISQSESLEGIHQSVQSKPIISPQFDFESAVTSVPELLQTIQPPLLDIGPIEQPQIYLRPTTSAQDQFDGMISPVRESNQSLQPQLSPNQPDKQLPVYTQMSTPSKAQFEDLTSPLKDSLKDLHAVQHIATEQPITSKQATISTQPQIRIQTGPIREAILNLKSESPQNLPVHTNPPSTRVAQLVEGSRPVEQPLDYDKLKPLAQVEFERPAEPLNELKDLQPKQQQDIVPIEQPSVFDRPSALKQTLSVDTVSSVNENIQSPHSQPLSNLPIGQPTIFNTSPISTNTQLDDSASPVREFSPVSQSFLPQNGQVDQSLVYRDPSNPALTLAQTLPDREKESKQNVQSHISLNGRAGQPTIYIKPSQTQSGKQFNPVQDTVQNLQPQISRISAPGESNVYNKPLSSSQAQLADPVRPIQSSLQNIQPQISQVVRDEQPGVYGKSVTLSQPQLIGPEKTVQGTVENTKLQISQHKAAEQPIVYKESLTPSQPQLVNRGKPVQGHSIEIQPQIPIQQPPVLREQIKPLKYQTSYPESVTPQSVYPTLASPTRTRSKSNVPTISQIDTTVSYVPNDIPNVGSVGDVNKYQYSTTSDNGEILVVEPLSPAPDVRINLPKQLLVSSPRQIDLISSKPALPKLPQSLLIELKEKMLKVKSKPAESEAVPLEPVSQFDREINIPKMEQILGNILYRFNYTAGYHGHHEQGDQGGNKEGGYYVITRDGYRRIVDYTANEDGYRPRIHIEFAQPQDVPQTETENEKGLGGYEFKWFYLR